MAPYLTREKVNQAQEARENQFFFQNVQNNEIFEIFKMSKNNRWINEITQKANACSLFDLLFCSVVPFSGKFGPKTQIVSLSWNLVLRLIQICEIPWWCSLFVFLIRKPFWVNLVQKIKTVSVSWNLVPRPIWICRIQW